MDPTHQRRVLSPEEAELVRRFRNGGCVRRPSEERCDIDGVLYKKGWEIRFRVHKGESAADIVRAALAVGLRPGSPYAKGAGWVVPVYGREVVEWFEALLRRTR